MVSPNVTNLLQQAKSLSLPEREQFLDLLKSQAGLEQPSPDEVLAATLAKRGIKLTVPPQRTPEEVARFKAWRPIELPGESLSDELIRDRR